MTKNAERLYILRKEKQGKTSDAQRRANAKYDKANTRLITLKLNKKTDKDVLGRLDEVPNRQGYIKELVRADIREG